jgi:hypothetical protein
MLNEIFDEDSAVEYSFTGRETSPKAMVDVPIARAAIGSGNVCSSSKSKQGSRPELPA